MEKYLDRLVQYDPENNRTTILTTSKFGGKRENRGPHKKDGGMDARGMQKETSHLSVFSYLKWSSTPELYERVEIFDFHQQPLYGKEQADSKETTKHNLFADFVCQSLPSAPNTCRHLMEVPNKAIHLHSSFEKSFCRCQTKISSFTMLSFCRSLILFIRVQPILFIMIQSAAIYVGKLTSGSNSPESSKNLSPKD